MLMLNSFSEDKTVVVGSILLSGIACLRLLVEIRNVLARQFTKVYPTTEKLGEDLARPLPFLVRVLGIVLDNKFVLSLWNPWDVTDPDKLLNKGARQAGK